MLIKIYYDHSHDFLNLTIKYVWEVKIYYTLRALSLPGTVFFNKMGLCALKFKLKQQY